LAFAGGDVNSDLLCGCHSFDKSVAVSKKIDGFPPQRWEIKKAHLPMRLLNIFLCGC